MDYKPEVDRPDSSLGKAVGLFTDRFGMPKRVIYPGCGVHVIDHLFPGSEVIYVDPDQFMITVLRKGIGDSTRAVLAPVENFMDGRRFDLLFSLNSHAKMLDQLRLLKSGGHVFCNNYVGTQDAEDVIKTGMCNLLAIINTNVINGEDPAKTSYEAELITDDLGLYTEFYDAPNRPEYYPKRRKLGEYYVFKKL